MGATLKPRRMYWCEWVRTWPLTSPAAVWSPYCSQMETSFLRFRWPSLVMPRCSQTSCSFSSIQSGVGSETLGEAFKSSGFQKRSCPGNGGETAPVSAHPLHTSDHQNTQVFYTSQKTLLRAELPSLLIRPHGTICLTSPCTEHACNFGVQLPAPARLSDSTRSSRSCSAFKSHVPPQVREPYVQAQGDLQPGPWPGGSLGTWMSPMANGDESDGQRGLAARGSAALPPQPLAWMEKGPFLFWAVMGSRERPEQVAYPHIP